MQCAPLRSPRTTSSREAGALVVIEEAIQGDPRGVGTLVQTLRRKRPRGQVILTSQIPLVMPEDWLTLSLGGLPNADLGILLEHPGLDGEDLQMLLSHVDGNPRLAKTIANLALQGAGVGAASGPAWTGDLPRSYSDPTAAPWTPAARRRSRWTRAYER